MKVQIVRPVEERQADGRTVKRPQQAAEPFEVAGHDLDDLRQKAREAVQKRGYTVRHISFDVAGGLTVVVGDAAPARQAPPGWIFHGPVKAAPKS